MEVSSMPGCLLVRVSEPRNRGQIALAIAAGLVFGFLLSRSSWSSPSLRLFVLGLYAISLLRGIATLFRGCKVELRVTNLDISSRGHSTDGYRPSTISRADVTLLTFREASGGADVPENPRGLYIEHLGMGKWKIDTCVLPQVNREQAQEIVETIYSRFPDTGTLSSSVSETSPLISLNLGRF